MNSNILKKIPYTLLINILYLTSIFFILVSIDNCIWFNYKIDKSIIYQENNVNNINNYNENKQKFNKNIEKLIDNIKMEGSLNYICLKSTLNINNLNENTDEILLEDYEQDEYLSNKIDDVSNGNGNGNDKEKEMEKKLKKQKIEINNCFYINSKLNDNIKILLLKKVYNKKLELETDVNNDSSITQYEKNILLQKIQNYFEIIQKKMIKFFENDNIMNKTSVLIKTTNYFKTAFKISVLLIVAKMLLSLFSNKKWLSLVVIPLIVMTIFFVLYFFRNNPKLGFADGLNIDGVGVTNMLIGSILFFVSFLLNFLF